MGKVLRSNHAMQVRTASTINTALGLYLIASPWVWGFNLNGAATWNCVAVGIVVAAIGATRVRDPHYAGTLSWINLILGAWIIVSPWIFGYTPYGPGMWNSIILGAVVLILAIWSGTATATEHPAAPIRA